jgi:hypothetical protein
MFAARSQHGPTLINGHRDETLNPQVRSVVSAVRVRRQFVKRRAFALQLVEGWSDTLILWHRHASAADEPTNNDASSPSHAIRLMQLFRPKVGIALQHLPVLVPGYERHLLDPESSLE